MNSFLEKFSPLDKKSVSLAVAFSFACSLAYASGSPTHHEQEKDVPFRFENCVAKANIGPWELAATGREFIARQRLSDAIIDQDFRLFDPDEGPGHIHFVFSNGNLRLIDYFDPLIVTQEGFIIEYLENELAWTLSDESGNLVGATIFDVFNWTVLEEEESERVFSALDSAGSLTFTMSVDAEFVLLRAKVVTQDFDAAMSIAPRLEEFARANQQGTQCDVPAWEGIHMLSGQDDAYFIPHPD